MRCFIAIDLPKHVQSRVFHKFEILKSKRLFRGRIVSKDDLHLTLKFLGNMSENKIQDIKTILKKVKFSKFSGTVGKTGFFDNEDNIKIIWVELLADKIELLQKEINKEINSFREDSLDKFVSHITMARVMDVLNKQELIKEVNKMNFRKLDFEVNEFLLIKSELTRQGTRYKVLERFTLN